MIIETTTFSDGEMAFLEHSVMCVSKKQNTKQTIIYLYGKTDPVIVQMDYKDALGLLKKADNRDMFGGQKPIKTEQKDFNEVVVCAHRFSVNIRSSEYKDGVSNSLKLYTNFELNDAIRDVINEVNGINDRIKYVYLKYEHSFDVGKMFDPEKVRQDLEDAIKNYLSI